MPINNYIKWPAERIRQDENNRLISDVQITTWNGKADSDHNHDDKYIPLTGTARFDTSIIPKKACVGILGSAEYPLSLITSTCINIGNGNGKLPIQLDSNLGIIFSGKSSGSQEFGILTVNSIANRVTWVLPDISGTIMTDRGCTGIVGDYSAFAFGSATLGDANPFKSIKAGNVISTDSNKVSQIELDGINKKLIFYYAANADSTIYNTEIKLDSDFSPTSNIELLLPKKSGTFALTKDIPASLPASDVKDWAKADIKPSYTFDEITDKPDTFTPAAHKHKDEDIESISASKITGTISIENLPKAALERCVPVTNDEARFALTTDTVQLGDTVKVENTGLMYLVVDESKLNSEDGYQPYTAAAAASVPWTGVTGKPEKFTPDTHTHTITEVTDLQTTLDGKAAKNHVHDSEKVTNWNNAIVSGAYYAAADAVNNPSADAAYSGNVVKGSTIVTQTVVKETIDGDLYKYIRRGQLDTNRTTVTTWGQWQEIQYVVTE